MIEDAQERAKVESQLILKIAKLGAEEQDRTMRPLIDGDERVAARVFKENIKLREDLRITERALNLAKQEIEHWKNEFQSRTAGLKILLASSNLSAISVYRLYSRKARLEERALEQIPEYP